MMYTCIYTAEIERIISGALAAKLGERAPSMVCIDDLSRRLRQAQASAAVPVIDDVLRQLRVDDNDKKRQVGETVIVLGRLLASTRRLVTTALKTMFNACFNVE